MESNAGLHQKFLALQEEVQRRVQLRLEKQVAAESGATATTDQLPAARNASATVSASAHGPPFLKDLYPRPSRSFVDDELVEHLHGQIKMVKEENARLREVINEREFEVRKLIMKVEDVQASSGLQVTNDTVAAKVVAMARKVRDMTAALESEKNRCKQWRTKYEDLQLQMNKMGRDLSENNSLAKPKTETAKEANQMEMKVLLDRLKQAETKLSEFRNQNSVLKQELKVANRVLVLEIGEGATFQTLIGANSTWRGRAQTIRNLQSKLEDARRQLQTLQAKKTSTESLAPKQTLRPSRSLELRQRDDLRKMEKGRKDALEKAAVDLKVMTSEHDQLKETVQSFKARIQSLGMDKKKMKQQMEILMGKERHNDELITVLKKQQQVLMQQLALAERAEREGQERQEQSLRMLDLQQQKANNVQEQLKAILAQREAHLHLLEQQLLQTGQSASVALAALPENRNQSCVPLRSGSLQAGTTSLAEGNSVSGGKISAMASQESQKAALKSRCEQLEFLFSAAKVENDKLNELLKMQEKRLSELVLKQNDLQSETLLHKKKWVELEKKLLEGNQKDPIRSVRRFVPQKSNGFVRGVPTDGYEVNRNQEIKIALQIQQDENKALKVALQNTLQAKAEDLKVFQKTLEETKSAFTKALQQLKQGQQVAAGN